MTYYLVANNLCQSHNFTYEVLSRGFPRKTYQEGYLDGWGDRKCFLGGLDDRSNRFPCGRRGNYGMSKERPHAYSSQIDCRFLLDKGIIK